MKYPVVFLSYDEPNADANYKHLLQIEPQALRVHGVKGSDAAHKAVAALIRERHPNVKNVFTVDGDNQLIKKQWDDLQETIYERHVMFQDEDQNWEEKVYSWRAINNVNGLCYGNGGLKLWPLKWIEEMRTHEASEGPTKVDFCWDSGYVQLKAIMSHTVINGSPYQAFRSGFREGVKMMTKQGRPLDRHTLAQIRQYTNVQRFVIWSSVGSDIQFGKFAILGALLGFKYTLGDDYQNLLLDHDKTKDLWECIDKSEVDERIDQLRQWAKVYCGLEIPKLGPLQSKTCKLMVEYDQPANLFQVEEWNRRISTLS